ncbi:recombination protein RecR [Candidatus Izimaplasma bacterium ZiA1]|uniref:recombination mediator RecR n=1 Tax=Candidatus Izimoplasma sp. ZiA1 TaxID=2024899 RepID=UPI000BAA5FEF|nr:recombination protein RecR [Candidatus Izimaplasma bacterium ZiA1]
MKYPRALDDLLESFRKYPGVGKKTAERYALHTVTKFSEEEIDEIIGSFQRIKTEIFDCPICGNITDQNPCYICKDDSRDKSKIIVVEESKDIIVMEKMNSYHGLYHVLKGAISPSNGVGPEDINLSSLMERLKDDKIKEVILATNLSNEGETTALYIRRILEGSGIFVTRIAHGIPAGANIEYADEVTLSKALEGRREF